MAISRKNLIYFAGLLHKKHKVIAQSAGGALYLRRSSLDSTCVSEPPSRGARAHQGNRGRRRAKANCARMIHTPGARWHPSFIPLCSKGHMMHKLTSEERATLLPT